MRKTAPLATADRSKGSRIATNRVQMGACRRRRLRWG